MLLLDLLFLENIGGVYVNSLKHDMGHKVPTGKNGRFSIDANDILCESQYYSAESVIDVLKSRDGHFKILTFNCQSLKSKFDELSSKYECCI